MAIPHHPVRKGASYYSYWIIIDPNEDIQT